MNLNEIERHEVSEMTTSNAFKRIGRLLSTAFIPFNYFIENLNKESMVKVRREVYIAELSKSLPDNQHELFTSSVKNLFLFTNDDFDNVAMNVLSMFVRGELELSDLRYLFSIGVPVYDTLISTGRSDDRDKKIGSIEFFEAFKERFPLSDHFW